MSEQTVGYVFPAWLVNTLIAAILTALLGVGGYMAIWNRADAAFKAQITERLAIMTERLTEMNHRVNGSLVTLPVTQQQVVEIDRRLTRLEQRVDQAAIK